MLAWVLEQRRAWQPGLSGRAACRMNFGVSARSGLRPDGSAAFVIEADEYDTAFFDKRSKFVHYRPRTAILNNLEFDHADIFDDLAAIERQFHHLVRTVPAIGPRRSSTAWRKALHRVLHMGCWSEVRSFGAARSSDFCAPKASRMTSTCCASGQAVARVQWALAGVHNQLNALAAIAAAEHVGVAPGGGAAALGQLSRTCKRRMEVRAMPGAGTGSAVTVYDDFAHHPTAIRTTVDGLRRKVGRGAHPGGVRAAQQHHETGHHESPAALEPGRSRPGLLPQRRPGLGRARGAGARWATRPQVARHD